VRDGRALLFVSHLKREPATTRVRVDRGRIGLGTGDAIKATDALGGAPIDVKADEIELSFNGMTYRLVEIAK
jgi:hypothetical protein